MPKKWKTLKEAVDLIGKEFLSKAMGITIPALNNYLYKGTEPCGAVKILAHQLGIEKWWLGEVPMPPKIKRFKKEGDTINSASETKELKTDEQDIANMTTDDILGNND